MQQHAEKQESLGKQGRRDLKRERFFFFNDTATTEIYTLSLHDALPISTDLNAVAEQTFLPGMYRDAAARLGYATPTTDRKIGRAHV